MEENTEEICQNYAFHHLFWKQQLGAIKVRYKRQIKWHPMMIRWCLSLKLLSTASYRALRSSNLLVLPSERTLRDYTHLVQAKPGFQPDLDKQLCRDAKIDTIPEHQKYVCIVFDEVKVKEDLIYNKYSSKILGFVRLGEVNDHLSKFEKSKDSETPHIVTFSGFLFSDLQFPHIVTSWFQAFFLTLCFIVIYHWRSVVFIGMGMCS